jgi:hypothetical protein
MSAWTVYWVMQASFVQGVVIGTMFAMLILGIAVPFTGLALADDSDQRLREIGEAVLRKCKWLWTVCVLLLVASALTPNTKTLCACLTIPKIVNNETLQADATEIYELGMSRLKEELGVTTEAKEEAVK